MFSTIGNNGAAHNGNKGLLIAQEKQHNGQAKKADAPDQAASQKAQPEQSSTSQPDQATTTQSSSRVAPVTASQSTATASDATSRSIVIAKTAAADAVARSEQTRSDDDELRDARASAVAHHNYAKQTAILDRVGATPSINIVLSPEEISDQPNRSSAANQPSDGSP